MNQMITLLGSYLLTIIDHELQAHEPQIIAAVEDELQLLINKLETLMKTKLSTN